MSKDPQLFQTILAGIIIAAACLFVLFKAIKKIKQPVGNCSGCSSDCGGCEITALKKDIEEARKRKLNNETEQKK